MITLISYRVTFALLLPWPPPPRALVSPQEWEETEVRETAYGTPSVRYQPPALNVSPLPFSRFVKGQSCGHGHGTASSGSRRGKARRPATEKRYPRLRQI